MLLSEMTSGRHRRHPGFRRQRLIDGNPVQTDPLRPAPICQPTPKNPIQRSQPGYRRHPSLAPAPTTAADYTITVAASATMATLLIEPRSLPGQESFVPIGREPEARALVVVAPTRKQALVGQLPPVALLGQRPRPGRPRPGERRRLALVPRSSSRRPVRHATLTWTPTADDVGARDVDRCHRQWLPQFQDAGFQLNLADPASPTTSCTSCDANAAP